MELKTVIIIGFGAVLSLLVGCQPSVNQETEKARIKAVLDSYITSIESEDINLYGKILEPDPNMVNFGTSEPPIVGWESLRKVIEDQNAALSQTKIAASDLNICLSERGDFAWATDLWDFRAMMDGQPLQIPVRCTWILEKLHGQWAIVHFHKSVRAAS